MPSPYGELNSVPVTLMSDSLTGVPAHQLCVSYSRRTGALQLCVSCNKYNLTCGRAPQFSLCTLVGKRVGGAFSVCVSCNKGVSCNKYITVVVG